MISDLFSFAIWRPFPFFIFFLVNGCIAAPLVGPLSDLNDLAAGSQRKYAMLQNSAGLFHEAIRWGNLGDALAMVVPEAQGLFYNHYASRKRKEKFVDFQIENILLKDDGLAVVEVSLQYIPFARNVVETRQEKESWEFRRFSGGWRWRSAEETPTQPEEDEAL